QDDTQEKEKEQGNQYRPVLSLHEAVIKLCYLKANKFTQATAARPIINPAYTLADRHVLVLSLR
ncbi:MAG: hypothetical protein PHP59_11830, partial [Methanofollis sp.]|uniref:hypothetical protein n=1 Tax=Methanofollis sp. TaxID=2052835 RepID=UPI00261EF238